MSGFLNQQLHRAKCLGSVEITLPALGFSLECACGWRGELAIPLHSSHEVIMCPGQCGASYAVYRPQETAGMILSPTLTTEAEKTTTLIMTNPPRGMKLPEG